MFRPMLVKLDKCCNRARPLRMAELRAGFIVFKHVKPRRVHMFSLKRLPVVAGLF